MESWGFNPGDAMYWELLYNNLATALAWNQQQVHRVTAAELKAANVTPDAIKDWTLAGTPHYLSMYWSRLKITPTLAYEWQINGFDQDTAEPWIKLAKSPKTGRKTKLAIDTPVIEAWLKTKATPHVAKAAAAHNITANDLDPG